MRPVTPAPVKRTRSMRSREDRSREAIPSSNRHDHRVPEPAGIGGLEQEILDVVERRPPPPITAVILVVGELVVRLHGRDGHPVEREQQHEDEDRERQVDHEDLARQRVVVGHADHVVGELAPVSVEVVVLIVSLLNRLPPCCHLRRWQAERS